MSSEYSGRVKKIWMKNAAGPVAVVCAIVLPIAGVIFHGSPAVIVALLLAPLLIAALLTWPAHFEVWKQDRAGIEKDRVGSEKEVVLEREKPETAEVFNAKPELQGQLSGFRLSGNPGESRTGNTWRCYASAACKLYVCNSKPMKATLKELVIDGSALDPPAEFSQVTFLKGADKILEQGVGVNYDLLVTYSFKGLQWKQIGKVDLKNVKVYGVDSLGGRHLLSVPQTESLPTP